MRRKEFLGSLAATAALASMAVPLKAAAQDAPQRTIRWGHLNTTDHPISIAARNFGKTVAERSGGRLKVVEYPASQLGSDLQQQSALRGGTQEMFSSSTSSLAVIVKEFGLLDFPFIVDSPAQSDALVDGPFGDALRGRLGEKGLVALTYWDLGFRLVTNSRRPIMKLEDFSGLKLRVVANPVYVDAFKALGANPVPMSFGEVYSALESRGIDGQENPLSVIQSAKLNEVQKYLSATNHSYTTPIVLMSKKFWDKLSAAEQKILQDAATESRAFQRKVNRQQTARAVDELKKAGMQYNELAAAERTRMRSLLQPVTDKLAADYDPQLVALFRSELARIQTSVQ